MCDQKKYQITILVLKNKELEFSFDKNRQKLYDFLLDKKDNYKFGFRSKSI